MDQAAFGNDNVAGDSGLVVALEGYEGPLDLLLALARSQKVDLKQISILQLVEQYLAFIAELRTIRLEIAADYLVMAAWLAFLKSRQLLPEPPKADEPDDSSVRPASCTSTRSSRPVAWSAQITWSKRLSSRAFSSRRSASWPATRSGACRCNS